MKFDSLSIPDVVLITPKVHGDERGFFMETFRQTEFTKYCGEHIFLQDNHSRSRHGVLRGLHFQLQNPQGKLIQVTQGEVFDVAVDLRQHSDTFGEWVGVILSDKNHQMLWVPPGFAHGFYVISETAEFHYKCTDYYAPHDEHTLKWDDTSVGISWPLSANQVPILSEKDRAGLPLESVAVFA